ncbi:MAG: hypothetical protein Q9180_002567 [Flavoplaca navasiana]
MTRPKTEEEARSIMAAAYQTAVRTDPISSGIHGTTWVNGQYKKDDPHLTICAKNATQQQQKVHEAAHGYTKTFDDYTLVQVNPDGYVKADTTKDKRGREIWPADLPTEVIMHTEPS